MFERNKKEQELYGSYCDTCWEILKYEKNQKCEKCNVSIYKERLYVSLDKHILCSTFWIKGGW